MKDMYSVLVVEYNWDSMGSAPDCFSKEVTVGLSSKGRVNS